MVRSHKHTGPDRIELSPMDFQTCVIDDCTVMSGAITSVCSNHLTIALLTAARYTTVHVLDGDVSRYSVPRFRFRSTDLVVDFVSSFESIGRCPIGSLVAKGITLDVRPFCIQIVFVIVRTFLLPTHQVNDVRMSFLLPPCTLLLTDVKKSFRHPPSFRSFNHD